MTGREPYQIANDLFAKTRALVAGKYCDIANVRAIDFVSECSTDSDKFFPFPRKAYEPTVVESNLQVGGILVPQRRSPIKSGEFVPVEGLRRIILIPIRNATNYPIPSGNRLHDSRVSLQLLEAADKLMLQGIQAVKHHIVKPLLP